jgi:8-oxo-dGTP diphosphatase
MNTETHWRDMEQGSDIIRVTAAILAKDRKVLIARRRAGGHQPNRWEFPGGKIDPGESPRQCLRRELSEEFSIEAAVGEYLCSSLYRYDFGVIELMAFRVVWTGGSMALRAHRAVRWASPEALSGYDFSPADIPIAGKIQSGEIPL